MSGTKISNLNTLARPPAGPVFDAVIVNNGTTATNFQRPQGVIVQTDATGTVAGQGIALYAATGNNPSGDAIGAVANLYGGGATGAAGSNVFAGQATISNGNATDGTKTIVSSYLILNGGGIYPDGSSFAGGLRFAGGVAINGSSTETGAYITFIAGTAANATGTNIGGPSSMYGGPADGSGVTNIGGALYGIGGTAGVVTAGTLNTGGAASWEGGFGVNVGGMAKVQGGGAGGSGTGGDLEIGPGGGGSANGIFLVTNIGTVDPHVLNAKFQHSIVGVGFVGVYSQG